MSEHVAHTNTKTVYEGVAAEDLARDAVDLKVTLPQITPGAASGTLSAGITTASVNIQDRDGNKIAANITSANHVVATWEGESNLRYPPLVRQGEPVEVYKKADQDKYYWKTTGLGRTFRKTDRVHIEVGATSDSSPGQIKDDTNTYSAGLDSDQGKVFMKTSKANGEACAFSLEANTKDGTFHLSDDTASGSNPGNRIYMDTGTKSGTPLFQVNLSSGIVLQFQNQDCLIKVPRNMMLQSQGRIVFDSPIIVFNTKKVGTVIINAGSIAINSARDIILTAAGVFGLAAAASKISGVLVAASVRLSGLFKGSSGSSYTPVTISDPTSSQAVLPNNPADTSTATPVTNLPVS
jgi:hypothetical protein